MSEAPASACDVVVLAAGEERSVVLPVDVAAGEERRIALAFSLPARARLTIVVVGSCQGLLIVERTVRLLGADAAAVLTTAIDVTASGRIAVVDDVTVCAPRGKATVGVRHVVRDAARSEVRSRLTLMPEAHGTQAFARAEQMLLGERPFAGAIPELDIRVDDVACGHAAWVARPRERDRFYLTARGISESAVDDMLAQAFLCPIAI